MLLRLCQLKSRNFLLILLIVLSSCSSVKNDGPEASQVLLTTFPNKWFSVNPEHSLQDASGIPVPHLYFDTEPEFRSGNRVVNVIVGTPENSQHAYSIDLNSGQRYYTHTYCHQKDVWNNFNGTIHRPIFSVAYIPQILDQIGEPQKVIVWSRHKDYHETAVHNYRHVRLVGAFIEESCLGSKCVIRSNWLSRLVFVGVDADDPELSKVNSIQDFQKNFDWETSKAHLENIEGRNFIGEKSSPAIQISQLIEFEDAFDFVKKRSIFLSPKRMQKIQQSCHELYESLWENVGKFRPEDQPALTNEELVAKLKVIEKLKAQKQPLGFAARLQQFTKKYYQEISTCEKFVYHGNLNRNPEKFWFLSYMGIYYRLHREGYYFDCRSSTWQQNILNNRGEPVYNLAKEINNCNERQLDRAMAYLPNFLAGLKNEGEYFKFIDYDNKTFGTHNKIYTWIKMRSTTMACKDDPNLKIRKETNLFPEDVSWRKREVKDLAPDAKLIY